MNNKTPPLLAVRAIIRDEDGKILILKRALSDEYGGLWCLPGGKVDYCQTAEEAIIREVEEETSLKCTSVWFLFYMDGLPEKTDDKHYVTLFFHCQSKGKIRLNHESSAYSWVESKKLKDHSFAFNHDKILHKIN